MFVLITSSLIISPQAARDEWSNTLWANLDVNVLSDGIDGFTKELKRLPRQVKALPICHILEEKMKEFKESIPLFSDLKNEALRERYDFHEDVTSVKEIETIS